MGTFMQSRDLFPEVYERTMRNERGSNSSNVLGYVNDKRDAGQETLSGISRRYHPEWEGWAVVDAHKYTGMFPSDLHEDTKLNAMIRNFYRRNFWDSQSFSDIVDADIAFVIFDIYVLTGRTEPAQQAINAFYHQSIVKVDGKIGAMTVRELNIISTSITEKEEYLRILTGAVLGYLLHGKDWNTWGKGWTDRFLSNIEEIVG